MFDRKERKPWGEGEVIAVIEDSFDVMNFISCALKMSGFNGELRRYPYSRPFFDAFNEEVTLVLSDLNLPDKRRNIPSGVDGMGIYDWLRFRSYQGGFLMMTGDVDYMEKTGVRNGDFDIMIKPVPPCDFISKIQECLNKIRS